MISDKNILQTDFEGEKFLQGGGGKIRHHSLVCRCAVADILYILAAE